MQSPTITSPLEAFLQQPNIEIRALEVRGGCQPAAITSATVRSLAVACKTVLSQKMSAGSITI